MLVALEGIDGSGKATALANVVETLRQRGVQLESFSFPQYGKTAASELISRFLNSKTVSDNPHYMAAAFAMDRYECMALLRKSPYLKICDRYTPSNAAFQAARLPESERDDFIAWLVDFEFARLEIPKPDLIIYFDIDIAEAAKLVAAKAKRSYTDEIYDAYERDRAYQGEVAKTYQRMFERDVFSKWKKVAVTQGSQLRPPEAISDEIVNIIEDEFH